MNSRTQETSKEATIVCPDLPGHVPMVHRAVDGVVNITKIQLAVRFRLQLGTILVEREVRDESGVLLNTITEASFGEASVRLWKLFPGSYTCMGIPTTRFSEPSILTPDTRSSGIGKEPLESWKDIQYLSDSNSDGSPTLGSVDHMDSNQLTDPPPSFASDYIQPSVGKERSVIEALKSLVRLLGSTNEVRNLDYESINVTHVVFLPQQYDGNVVFEFPPAISVPGDVASQMEGMERKHDGHPWCKIFTTNIKNDVDLVLRKSLCAGKFEC